MRLNPAVALTLFSFLALPAAASGCDHESESGGENTCGEKCTYIERGGRATLFARTTFDDYQAATMSFEYATEVDEGQIRNDWDLLFGNDQDPEADHFTVNTVVDDRSFIVDFGPVTFCEIPEQVDPADFELGYFGDHDDIPVVAGHVYFVRTRDSESDVYAAFLVIEHRLNDSVTIQWFRSPDPTRFVKPTACE